MKLPQFPPLLPRDWTNKPGSLRYRIQRSFRRIKKFIHKSRLELWTVAVALSLIIEVYMVFWYVIPIASDPSSSWATEIAAYAAAALFLLIFILAVYRIVSVHREKQEVSRKIKYQKAILQLSKARIRLINMIEQFQTELEEMRHELSQYQQNIVEYEKAAIQFLRDDLEDDARRLLIKKANTEELCALLERSINNYSEALNKMEMKAEDYRAQIEEIKAAKRQEGFKKAAAMIQHEVADDHREVDATIAEVKARVIPGEGLKLDGGLDQRVQNMELEQEMERLRQRLQPSGKDGV